MRYFIIRKPQHGYPTNVVLWGVNTYDPHLSFYINYRKECYLYWRDVLPNDIDWNEVDRKTMTWTLFRILRTYSSC